jgi:hypothetical protein
MSKILKNITHSEINTIVTRGESVKANHRLEIDERIEPGNDERNCENCLALLKGTR